MLRDRIGRLERMAAAAEKTDGGTHDGSLADARGAPGVFGYHDPDRYAAEAEERWGKTDAFRESQRRVSTRRRPTGSS